MLAILVAQPAQETAEARSLAVPHRTDPTPTPPRIPGGTSSSPLGLRFRTPRLGAQPQQPQRDHRQEGNRRLRPFEVVNCRSSIPQPVFMPLWYSSTTQRKQYRSTRSQASASVWTGTLVSKNHSSGSASVGVPTSRAQRPHRQGNAALSARLPRRDDGDERPGHGDRRRACRPLRPFPRAMVRWPCSGNVQADRAFTEQLLAADHHLDAAVVLRANDEAFVLLLRVIEELGEVAGPVGDLDPQRRRRRRRHRGAALFPQAALAGLTLLALLSRLLGRRVPAGEDQMVRQAEDLFGRGNGQGVVTRVAARGRGRSGRGHPPTTSGPSSPAWSCHALTTRHVVRLHAFGCCCRCGASTLAWVTRGWLGADKRPWDPWGAAAYRAASRRGGRWTSSASWTRAPVRR